LKLGISITLAFSKVLVAMAEIISVELDREHPKSWPYAKYFGTVNTLIFVGFSLQGAAYLVEFIYIFWLLGIKQP